jgi:hypothetical protein
MSAESMTELGFEHVLVRGSGSATLLLLHSTGGDEHQLVELAGELAPEATLLSPRGQVLEDGTTRRFFRRLGTFELDIPDLLARTDELADFFAAATAAYASTRVACSRWATRTVRTLRPACCCATPRRWPARCSCARRFPTPLTRRHDWTENRCWSSGANAIHSCRTSATTSSSRS